MSAAERRVRITLEATMRPASNRTHLQLVDVGHSTFLLDPDAEGVTVEDVVPPRTWTDHDVVQVASTGLVWVRGTDEWDHRADDIVTRHVDDGDYRVLRYQAGE